MVLDTAELKNKRVPYSLQRVEDAAKELTLKKNITKEFTIERDQVYRESQLKIGRTEQKCIEMNELAQQARSHVPSIQRGIQEIPRTMVSHIE